MPRSPAWWMWWIAPSRSKSTAPQDSELPRACRDHRPSTTRGRMWLSQLTLVNFRNLTHLRLEPQPGVLLFCGSNGQGKTNLLESVYVLATTRSPRTHVERETPS